MRYFKIIAALDKNFGIGRKNGLPWKMLKKDMLHFKNITTKTKNENMKNAVIYGSNLASFCVEKFGTERMEDLHNNEVQDRLKVFKELTQFDIKLA